MPDAKPIALCEVVSAIDSNADLSATATSWMDRLYDPERRLLWGPDSGVHLVAQSAWYALGLLQRGDSERAADVIEAICALQYDSPGTPWHGTFALFAEWPEPADGAIEFADYDPNWRQFIGTAFTLLLRLYPDDVPADRITRAAQLAVDSEPDGRVAPWYSNIALKRAWLDVEWGHVERGEALAEQVVTLFDNEGAFPEFNSPTYYGVDLWALALWRTHSSSQRLREWGARLEDAVWREVASMYHPGLRNIAGPYTRAYGLDMTQYLALVGLWMWEALGVDASPVPDVGEPFGHAHDFCFGPCPAALGVRVPPDVRDALTSFTGERSVAATISRTIRRSATAWFSDTAMIGAESGDLDFGDWDQFVPGTVHWQQPDGSIGAIKLVQPGPPSATAEPGVLRVGRPDARFVHDGVDLDDGRTDLPGVILDVSRHGDASVLELRHLDG